MSSKSLLEFEARIDIAAVDALPWETSSPASGHISAEGIRL